MSLGRAEMERWLAGGNRKKAIALTVLFTLLAIVWGRNLLTRSPGRAIATPGGSDVTLPDPVDERPVVASAPPVDIDWPPLLDRNPFAVDRGTFEQKPVVVVQADPVEPPPPDVRPVDLTLNLTFLGDDPRAIINGRALHVGDSIEGFTVKRIELRRVTLVRGDVEVTLEM